MVLLTQSTLRQVSLISTYPLSEKNFRHKDLRCSRFPLPVPHPHLRTQLRVTVEAMVDSMPLPMEWSAIEQSEQIEKVVVEERLQEDQKQQKGHLTNWQHCLDLAIPAGACTCISSFFRCKKFKYVTFFA